MDDLQKKGALPSQDETNSEKIQPQLIYTQEKFHEIKQKPHFWMFRAYGFLKNIKFFEPYLILILLSWELSLLQIGGLIALENFCALIFETISGIIADLFGRKKALMVYFVLYSIGLGFLFFGNLGWPLVIGFILMGTGEAFRSDTIKAILLTWMDNYGFVEYRTYIYGRYRTLSQLGGAFSSLISIVFIFVLPILPWLFLISISPFVLNFILVVKFPSDLSDSSRNSTEDKRFSALLREIGETLKKRKLLRIYFSSASYNAIFKNLKDYIQPIIKILIVGVIWSMVTNPTEAYIKNWTAVFLGLIYAGFYLISAVAANNSYRVHSKAESSKKAMDSLHLILVGTLTAIAFFYYIQILFAILVLYLFMWWCYNIQRPLVMHALSGVIPKRLWTTLWNLDSQSEEILTIGLAPLFGLLVIYSGFEILFLIIAGVLLFVNLFLLKERTNLRDSISK